MKKASLFLICFFAIALASLHAQNGWTRPAKGIYSQLSLTTFSSNKYYSQEGTLFDQGSIFSSNGLLFYGEYGLNDRLTAMLDLPLLMLNRFNTTQTVAGLGNARLGLKYGLLKSFPLSLAIEAEVPTDDGVKLANTLQPNDIGIIEQINLPTSDGEFNIWTTLAASRSTASGKTFGSVYTSFNYRTQGFSPQLQAGVEIGHLLWDKVYLIGKAKIQERLNTDLGQGGSFLYGEGTTFASYNLTAMYKLDTNWRLIGSAASFTDFAGVQRRNIYDGWQLSLGIAWER